MTQNDGGAAAAFHSHVFLGENHQTSERKTWSVIWLCAAMMIIEIAGGWLFGSIALIADGLHMSTHAGALLLAALAYTYAREHADDPRFSFGTGKLGDLAGFTSAIVLAMIALLIGYESVVRLFAPIEIHFGEALPIAVVGLVVNVVSAWLLSGGHHHDHGAGHHHHGHHAHAGHGDQDRDHEHDRDREHEHAQAHEHDDIHRIETADGILTLEVFEAGVPPRFRVRAESGPAPSAAAASIETARPDGARQLFRMVDRGGYLESADAIPEPHAFEALARIDGRVYPVVFEEHEHQHGHAHAAPDRDNNMRAALVHVMADAAVSVLVIIGLLLARAYGFMWMDPLAGIIGAVVIASWAYRLIRDTGAILLDMNPDRAMAGTLRQAVEADGDQIADLHLWRLGPGHLGAILSIVTRKARGPEFYRDRLARVMSLSHLTIEVSHRD